MGQPLPLLSARVGGLEFTDKAIFFMRTNKGGGRRGARSRLVPIARLFQRRMLWMSGAAHKFLKSKDHKKSMAQAKQKEKNKQGEDNGEDSESDYDEELIHEV